MSWRWACQRGRGSRLYFTIALGEVVWEQVRNGACGFEEALKLCLECTITYCNPGAPPLLGLGRELGCLESDVMFAEEVWSDAPGSQ